MSSTRLPSKNVARPSNSDALYSSPVIMVAGTPSWCVESPVPQRRKVPRLTPVSDRSDRRYGPLPCAFDNRVTELLGVDIPIFQAPMGYVAKPPLVAAVSEAGAMGLVPGSLGTDVVRDGHPPHPRADRPSRSASTCRWRSCATRRSSR